MSDKTITVCDCCGQEMGERSPEYILGRILYLSKDCEGEFGANVGNGKRATRLYNTPKKARLVVDMADWDTDIADGRAYYTGFQLEFCGRCAHRIVQSLETIAKKRGSKGEN